MKDNIGMFDQNRARELYLQAEYHFWPLIGTVNQIAGDAFFDAYDLLDERGLIKQSLKKPVNNTLKDWKKYQKTVQRSIGDKWYLWQDVVNIASHNINPDIIKLHMSIKRAMDRDRVSDTDLRSAVHLTQTLLELSTMFFDSYLHQFQAKTMLDISKDFMFGRLTDMFCHWKPVTRYFSHCKNVIDLNEDPNVKLGVSIIIKRFSDTSFINDAAGKAMHLNPEMAKYAMEEDKKYFQQHYDSRRLRNTEG